MLVDTLTCLRQAVKEGDPVARLALADLLEEQGQPLEAMKVRNSWRWLKDHWSEEPWHWLHTKDETVLGWVTTTYCYLICAKGKVAERMGKERDLATAQLAVETWLLQHGA